MKDLVGLYLYCSVVIQSFYFNFSGAHEEGKHSHNDLKDQFVAEEKHKPVGIHSPLLGLAVMNQGHHCNS